MSVLSKITIDGPEWVNHPLIPEMQLVRVGNAIKASYRVENKESVTYRSFSLAEIQIAEMFNYPAEVWSIVYQTFLFDHRGAHGEIVFVRYGAEE